MVDTPNNGKDRVGTAHQAPAAAQTDQAAKSLADALRVSFRVLTVIMVFVVIAFLLTGLKSIEAQEIGILKVFGKVVDTAKQGLAYTWPFPVGEIEIVNTSERSLMIEDFWMNETAHDKTKKLSQRRAASDGLRPGWDGALLTGDRNLLHVKLFCQYSITGPEGAKACMQNIENLEEMIRSQVCRAAIQAAANITADSIMRAEKGPFARDILRRAQRALNELTRLEGRAYQAVRISKISTEDTWPIRALRAYEAAQNAVSNRDKVRNQAIGDARRTLNEAAGANYQALVGRPVEFAGSAGGQGEKGAAGPYDLIGQYAQQDDPAKAAEIIGQIEQVLLSNSTGGEAAAMIADAKAYKTQIIQSTESRAKRFEELLDRYEKTPKFLLERLWADTRDEILSGPTIEKYYITSGDQKTVLQLNRDPGVVKEIQNELLKLKKAKQDQRGGRK